MSEASSQDELFYRRAMRRIYLNILGLSVAGVMAAAWRLGPAWALGFLIGASASAINFRWLHNMVDSVGPGGRKPGKTLGLFLSLRYVLLGIVGYVIVRYFEVDIMAALVGLFVAVAAVLVEVVYELIYARA